MSHYILPIFLSADSTFTFTNLCTALKEVENVFSRVGVGYFLDVARSVLDETRKQPFTPVQNNHTLFHYYLDTHPASSWNHVAEALYKAEEHRALKKVMVTYVKGEGAVYVQHTFQSYSQTLDFSIVFDRHG